LLVPALRVKSYLVQDARCEQVIEYLLALFLSDASVNGRGHFINSSLPVGILFQLGLRSGAPVHRVLQGFLELFQKLLEFLGLLELSIRITRSHSLLLLDFVDIVLKEDMPNMLAQLRVLIVL
jgi:hypothetical protein